VAVTGLAVGLLPRASIGLGWGIFGVGVGVGLFGGLLNLPDGVEKVSPFSNVPVLPTDDWVPSIILGAIAIAVTAAAALTFRRRDLST
jgi:ABC-2 type transport system permease protein